MLIRSLVWAGVTSKDQNWLQKVYYYYFFFTTIQWPLPNHNNTKSFPRTYYFSQHFSRKLGTCEQTQKIFRTKQSSVHLSNETSLMSIQKNSCSGGSKHAHLGVLFWLLKEGDGCALRDTKQFASKREKSILMRA